MEPRAQRLLFVLGTRPEAIKLAPLIKLAQQDPRFDVRTCITGQHREMLDQVLTFFGIVPDTDLALMRPAQTLPQLTADILTAFTPVLDELKPDRVFVQGDTTTVLAAALASFYQRIPVAHVEAGLRSGDRLLPFPEEMNRLLASRLSDLHFAPTEAAAANLRKEGIERDVHVTGNTVIDALQLALGLVREQSSTYEAELGRPDPGERIILVTCHRRESFGAPFRGICGALRTIVDEHPDVRLIYPVHLNPNIREVAHALLTHPRITLLPPLGYPQLIWLMDRCHLVLTDSGGIQEEAPTLGKPVLVLRNVTERTEGVEAGTARLVGDDPATIVQAASQLLRDGSAYQRMARAVNPYGDGTASRRILDIVADHRR